MERTHMDKEIVCLSLLLPDPNPHWTMTLNISFSLSLVREVAGSFMVSSGTSCSKNIIMECRVDNEALWKCAYEAVLSIVETEKGDDRKRKHRLDMLYETVIF